MSVGYRLALRQKIKLLGACHCLRHDGHRIASCAPSAFTRLIFIRATLDVNIIAGAKGSALRVRNTDVQQKELIVLPPAWEMAMGISWHTWHLFGQQPRFYY